MGCPVSKKLIYIFFISFSYIDSTAEKMPYSCKHCNKCFSRSSVCKEHERIHTEVKLYKCRDCEKCFSQSSGCKIHERTHIGEKPYTCKHCKKCFSQIGNCKRHERTHTGEKPYTCHTCWICQEECSSEACLLKHYDDHMR